MNFFHESSAFSFWVVFFCISLFYLFFSDNIFLSQNIFPHALKGENMISDHRDNTGIMFLSSKCMDVMVSCMIL